MTAFPLPDSYRVTRRQGRWVALEGWRRADAGGDGATMTQKHIHLFTRIFGTVTIRGKKYSRYSVCIRCGAKKP